MIRQPLITRQRVTTAVLALIALVLAVLIAHDIFFPAGPTAAAVRTATVSAGTVRSIVTGTGTVVPQQQNNVSFKEGGTLTEVDVKVGDHVSAGQVLARIDPTLLQAALQQAQAQLASAQAVLTATQDSNAVTSAQHSLSAAQVAYNDTVGQVNLTNQQNQTALSNAQQQYSIDLAPPPQSPSTLAKDVMTINQAQDALSLGQANGQRSIHQAQAAITQAQDALNAQTTGRPSTIAQEQASIAGAQAQLTTAQTNLNNATLTAPTDGNVAALNGEVGETVNAGGGTTAQSPGSTAPQPSGSGATSSTATGAGATASAGPFAVLSNTTSMEVVAPLAEGDAARAEAGQTATVTFDAITGLTAAAHVIAVAPSGTVISNVTNYYVTLALDQLDPRIRSGMTANASVTVSQATGVLVVPNSAITRIGAGSYVTVLARDGRTQTRVAVQLGTAGDSTTQVTAGVREGDRVVLPTLSVPTRTTATGGGARGGGGGVRLGG